MSDAELKMDGLKILNEKLGAVQAERFISLIQREKFDYTLWQRKLWEDVPLEQLSAKARKQRGEKKDGL